MGRRNIFIVSAAVVCAFFMAFTPLKGFAQLTFTDVAPQLHMDDRGTGADVIWYDWDGDGDQDLMVTRRFDGGNTFFRNDGDHFTRLDNTGLTPTTDGGMPKPMDIDHDGDLDFWMRCYHTNGELLVNDNGVWVDRTADLGIPVQTGWRDAAWVDFNHDGWVDLLTGHYTDGFHLYRNDGGTHFTDVTDSCTLPQMTQFAEIAEADVNFDGEIEFFITTVYDGSFYFVNDGQGHLRDATAEAGLSGAHGFQGCKWVDFDGDKYPDLLTQKESGHDIWHNNGDGTFTQMRVHGADVSNWGAGGGYPGGAMYAVADYNMDGLMDFYAGIPGGCNNDTAPNQLMIMDSVRGLDIYFHDVAPALGLDYEASTNPTAIDYDGDGAMDLCMAATNEPLRLFHNNTPRGQNSLQVQPLGPNGERDRWHTRVELYPHSSSHAIAASELNSSNVSRNGFNNYFVLDPNAHYDLRLYFACGTVMGPEQYPQLNDVVPSQVHGVLTVRMEVATSTPEQPAAVSRDFRMDPAYPNPFNATTTIRYDLPTSGAMKLAVYNINGQHVTDLVSGTVEQGSHEVHWNASSLASGMYLVKLNAAGKTATQKVILLK